MGRKEACVNEVSPIGLYSLMSRQSTKEPALTHARNADGVSASSGGACCAQALCALGDTFLAKGQALQAIKCREAVCELHSAGGSQLGEARSRLELARLLLAHTHDVPVARKQLDRAVQPVPGF